MTIIKDKKAVQLLLKINILRGIDAVIRSGKVIGDNVNIGANVVVAQFFIMIKNDF